MRGFHSFPGLAGLLVVALAWSSGGLVKGDIIINEIFIDAPGTDNGQEFFELRSTNNDQVSLSGLTFLAIEGDGTNPGSIDFAFNLSALSTGTNGLFLWRDSATVLQPAPDAGTSVFVGDFNPDIENGSNTFLLVSNFTGTVGTDLDTNNDGVLDTSPWSSIVDAMGLRENDGANNVVYTSSFITSATFNADFLARDALTLQLMGGDVTGTSPGPYSIDFSRFLHTGGFTSFNSANPGLTPGSVNIAAVPEPTSICLVSIALTPIVLRLRRKK